jgi:uncharacterized protein YjbI with pentapeptide repeats
MQVSSMPESGAQSQTFRNDDWYGEVLGAVRFVDCVFIDVDLSESMTVGATFEGCTFHGVRFNGSTHRTTAFVACEFRRCSLFTATLDGCKLTGSGFAECVMRPLTVIGGAWQSVSLRRHNLAGVDLTAVDLRDADLSMSDLTESVLAETRLEGALVRETDFTRADLRGARLGGVDLSSATLHQTRIDLQAAVMLAELAGGVVDLAHGG